MKLSFNYKKYFETNFDLKIDYINKPGLQKIKWIVGDLQVGKFDYMVQDDYVVIVSYNKYKDVPKGMGYKFIKICIDDLLKKHKGIFSPNKDRSLYSDMVWLKLEKEYDVVDFKLGDHNGKMIYSNSISDSLK